MIEEARHDARRARAAACETRRELLERAVAHEQAARELGRKPLYLQLLDQANYKVDDLRAELFERAVAHEEAVRELFDRQRLLCAQLAADARARRAEPADVDGVITHVAEHVDTDADGETWTTRVTWRLRPGGAP